MGKEEGEEKAGKWSFVLERRYRLIGTRRTRRVREVWEEGRGGVIQRPTVNPSTSCTRPRFVSAWKSMHCFASISFFRGSVERRRHRRRRQRRRFFSLPTTSSKKRRCRRRTKRRCFPISVSTLIIQKMLLSSVAHLYQ